MRLAMGLLAGICGLAAAFGLPAAGRAQPPLAYVLVTTRAAGADLAQPRADGLAVSRALIAAGVETVRRENADPAGFDLGAVAPVTFLYFSGPTRVQGDETWLLAPQARSDGSARPEGWPLYATIAALKARGALQVVAVVQGCHDAEAGLSAPPQPPSPPDPSPQPPLAQPVLPRAAPDPLDETLILLSADPARGCGATDRATDRITARFLAALGGGGDDLAAALAQTPGAGWVATRLRHRLPAPLPQSGAAAVASAKETEALLRSLPPAEAARLAALFQKLGRGAAGGGTVLIDPDAQADTGAGAEAGAGLTGPVAAASPSPLAPRRATDAGGLRLVEVSARVLLAARPTATGLPRPSVIVGEIAPTPTAFRPEAAATTPDSAGAAPLFSLSAPERAALRAQDPARFATLVESGAFDPPPEAIAAALQAELRRMGCYAGQIDGAWGAGSRAALDRYYATRKAEAPTQAATLLLYRDILAAADLTCPTAARQAPATPRAAATATTPRRATSATAAPAPAARTAPSGGIDAGALGRGVMR